MQKIRPYSRATALEFIAGFIALLSACTLLSALLSPLAQAQPPHKPAVTLANIYAPSKQINLNNYWASEKLDGVRGYWTGTQMLTRQGNSIDIPSVLKSQLPAIALDGELWIARNTFEHISALIRRKHTSYKEWSNAHHTVSYNVFDLPHHKGTFDQRLNALSALYNTSRFQNTFWRPVQQFKIANHKVLMEQLKAIEQLGGEGLMLHKGDSLYHSIRNDDLLKVKSFDDAEASITQHLPGKGKYSGMLGAIRVINTEGVAFNIGTGFSDAERANPPPIGSIITYKYYGKTHKGTPKFASFLRVRHAVTATGDNASKRSQSE